MTSAPAKLRVPAGSNTDRAHLARTPVDFETTDVRRTTTLVWRPLLDAEVSR